MAVRFLWFGDRVRQRVMDAVTVGVNDTTAAAAIEAKSNHPGWQNRTGTAEGSIRQEAAQVDGSIVRGRFGSFDVAYMIWLELKHGSALRRAADVEFPALGDRIREAYQRRMRP